MPAPSVAHGLFTVDATSRFLLVIAPVVVVCHALGALSLVAAAVGDAAVSARPGRRVWPGCLIEAGGSLIRGRRGGREQP